jgi:hypothetical protein
MIRKPVSSDPEQRERDTRESRRQSGLPPEPDTTERGDKSTGGDKPPSKRPPPEKRGDG